MGRLAILILMAGCSHAQTMGESQTVQWDEVEGLRLSSIGYRATDDPCRRAGETALTIDYLDDAADLVACPTGDGSAADLIEQFGAWDVGGTQSYRLLSVPHR